MAIDSAAKRKSVVAITTLFVGPVPVPDASISQFDRQVSGYGYGGIAAAEVVAAGFICIRNGVLATASATASIGLTKATATLEC